MVICKGRLGRICNKCEKRFVPTGKSQKLCNKCGNPYNSFLDKLYIQQNSDLKKNKAPTIKENENNEDNLK